MAGDKKITIKAELLTQGFENAQKLLRPLTDQITQINKLIRPTQSSQQQGLLGRIMNGSNRPGDTIAKQIRADAQSLGELRKAADDTGKIFDQSLSRSIRQSRNELERLVDKKKGLLAERSDLRENLAKAFKHGVETGDFDVLMDREQKRKAKNRIRELEKQIQEASGEEEEASDGLAQLERQRRLAASPWGSIQKGAPVIQVGAQLGKILTDAVVRGVQMNSEGYDIRASAEASRQSVGGNFYDRMTNGSGAGILDLYALRSMSKADGKNTNQSNLALAKERADAARSAGTASGVGQGVVGGLGVLGGLAGIGTTGAMVVGAGGLGAVGAAGAGAVGMVAAPALLGLGAIAAGGYGVYRGYQNLTANTPEADAMTKLGQQAEQGKQAQPIEQAVLRNALQNRERRADFGNLYASKFATDEAKINEEYLTRLRMGASYGMQEAQTASTLAQLSDAVGGTRGGRLFETVARSERDYGVRREVAMGTLGAITDGTKGGDPEKAKAIWSEIMSIAMTKGFKDSKIKEDFLTVVAQTSVGAGGAQAGVGMADMYSRVLGQDATRYDIRTAVGGTAAVDRMTGQTGGAGGVANFMAAVESVKELRAKGIGKGNIDTATMEILGSMTMKDMMANPDRLANLTNIDPNDPNRADNIKETRKTLLKKKFDLNASFFSSPEQQKMLEGYWKGDTEATNKLAERISIMENMGMQGTTLDERVSALKQIRDGGDTPVREPLLYTPGSTTAPRTVSDEAGTNIAIASLKNITELFSNSALREGLAETSKSLVLASNEISELSKNEKLGETAALLGSLSDSIDKLNTSAQQFHQTMVQMGFSHAPYSGQ